MIPKFFEKLFGPNWRTSASGIGAALMGLLTWVASLPYNIGTIGGVVDVGALIPPQYKATIALWSGVAACILACIRSMHTKDKVVSGTPATGVIVGRAHDEVRYVPPVTDTAPPNTNQ
jgi:hypothetical protein